MLPSSIPTSDHMLAFLSLNAKSPRGKHRNCPENAYSEARSCSQMPGGPLGSLLGISKRPKALLKTSQNLRGIFQRPFGDRVLSRASQGVSGSQRPPPPTGTSSPTKLPRGPPRGPPGASQHLLGPPREPPQSLPDPPRPWTSS